MYLYINNQTGEITKTHDWNMNYNYDEVTAIRIRIRKKDSRPIATILNPDGEWEAIPSEDISNKT